MIRIGGGGEPPRTGPEITPAALASYPKGGRMTHLELAYGRRAPFTQIGDWVSLAPISHQAARLYSLLKAHVNRARGDSLVWPSRGTLASMMRYSRPDKVDPLLKELEDLGAIDVQRGRRYPDGSPAPNLYLVHETPPPAYEGEPSLESWYATRKERQQRLAARAGGSQGSPEKGATPSPEKRATPSPEKRAPIRSNPEPEEVEPTYLAPQQRNGAAEPRLDQAGRQEETGEQDQQAVLPAVAAAAGQDQAATTDPATDRAAAELVDALEWPGTIDRARITASRRNLITAAASALAAGHHPDAVRATAVEAMPGAKTPGAVVARLRDLAATTPDPAVAAAAERTAAEQARKRLGRTPHQWVDDPRRPSYCGACGRTRATHPAEPQDQERVDQSEAPDTGQASPTGRCQHGRRICVTCHGDRDRRLVASRSYGGVL